MKYRNHCLDSRLCRAATAFAGSTITATNALTLSAPGSNVRIDVGSITSTGASLSGCATPDISTAFVLDPTASVNVAQPSSITCNVVSDALTQIQIEAGQVTWSFTANNVVAKGGNNSIDSVGDFVASYTKTLQQVRRYKLGVKRMPLNATDPMANVIWAGGLFFKWIPHGTFSSSWHHGR
jgi:hypothetical protein